MSPCSNSIPHSDGAKSSMYLLTIFNPVAILPTELIPPVLGDKSNPLPEPPDWFFRKAQDFTDGVNLSQSEGYISTCG